MVGDYGSFEERVLSKERGWWVCVENGRIKELTEIEAALLNNLAEVVLWIRTDNPKMAKVLFEKEDEDEVVIVDDNNFYDTGPF